MSSVLWRDREEQSLLARPLDRRETRSGNAERLKQQATPSRHSKGSTKFIDESGGKPSALQKTVLWFSSKSKSSVSMSLRQFITNRAPTPENFDLERSRPQQPAPSKREQGQECPCSIHFLGTNTVTVLSNRGRGDFSADLSMFPLAHLPTSLLGLKMST